MYIVWVYSSSGLLDMWMGGLLTAYKYTVFHRFWSDFSVFKVSIDGCSYTMTFGEIFSKFFTRKQA